MTTDRVRVPPAAEALRLDPEQVRFTPAAGDLPPLAPLIAQHAHTGEVLMLGWTDRIGLERTLAEGRLWFYSRSRRAHWMKGETSGNVMEVRTLALDCDADSLLALVLPRGPACHTGTRSCFGARPTLTALGDLIEQRRVTAGDASSESYTVRLLRDRNLRLKKLGEEALELALACSDTEAGAPAAHAGRVAEEAADLLYHTLVACAAAGTGVDAVLDRLASRLPVR